MNGERVKLTVGVLLLAVGVVSGIWFTERLRQYPGPPLEVELGALENETEDASLDGVLELALDEGRFVVADDAAYALTGRIQAEDGGYRVDVEVVELSAGSVLVGARETVSSKDALPGALDRISAELRRKLARGGIWAVADIASSLEPIGVTSVDGARVRLGSLWSHRPAVLVFIRHFGWMFCREQAAQLRGVAGAIRERGAELHVIGSGSPEQAAEFARERELDFPLYVDPDLESYRTAGLRRDLGATLHPRIVKNVLRTLGGGFRQGRTQGDPWQQGGAFVIAPGGTTALAQVSQVAGDHVDPEAILRALDSLLN